MMTIFLVIVSNAWMYTSSVTPKLSKTLVRVVSSSSIIMTSLRTLSRISLFLFNFSSLTFVLWTIDVSSDGDHGVIKRHVTTFFFIQVHVCLCCWTLLANLLKQDIPFHLELNMLYICQWKLQPLSHHFHKFWMHP